MQRQQMCSFIITTAAAAVSAHVHWWSTIDQSVSSIWILHSNFCKSTPLDTRVPGECSRPGQTDTSFCGWLVVVCCMLCIICIVCYLYHVTTGKSTEYAENLPTTTTAAAKEESDTNQSVVDVANLSLTRGGGGNKHILSAIPELTSTSTTATTRRSLSLTTTPTKTPNNHNNAAQQQQQQQTATNTKVWAWGSTGEEKWDPDLQIGVDWRSLTRSAMLPTTTDYFPDSHLISKYVWSEHQVLYIILLALHVSAYIGTTCKLLCVHNCNDNVITYTHILH